MAPAVPDARINAPFAASRGDRRVSGVAPGAAAITAIACPPTMPAAPAALAATAIARSLRSFNSAASRPSPLSGWRAISENASVSNASPDRIAMPSPNTTCAVGRPAHRVVVHGRQVVMDQEYV
jgi:hypothetical protein